MAHLTECDLCKQRFKGNPNNLTHISRFDVAWLRTDEPEKSLLVVDICGACEKDFLEVIQGLKTIKALHRD